MSAYVFARREKVVRPQLNAQQRGRGSLPNGSLRVTRHSAVAESIGPSIQCLPGPLTLFGVGSFRAEAMVCSSIVRPCANTRDKSGCYASRYYPRCALSACTAKSCRIAKNSGGWPMNSPSAVQALTVATAPPLPPGSVGRMIETTGNLRLRNFDCCTLCSIILSFCDCYALCSMIFS